MSCGVLVCFCDCDTEQQSAVVNNYLFLTINEKQYIFTQFLIQTVLNFNETLCNSYNLSLRITKTKK